MDDLFHVKVEHIRQDQSLFNPEMPATVDKIGKSIWIDPDSRSDKVLLEPTLLDLFGDFWGHKRHLDLSSFISFHLVLFIISMLMEFVKDYLRDNKIFIVRHTVLYYLMKIDIKHLGTEVRKILDEDGLSVIELSSKTGIAPETIYSILDGSRSTAQRATMRKIAEATGRSFVISGDSVTFVKITEARNGDLTAEEQQFLAMFRQLDDTSQDAAIDLLESMCRVAELGKKRRERSNSSGS